MVAGCSMRRNSNSLKQLQVTQAHLAPAARPPAVGDPLVVLGRSGRPCTFTAGSLVKRVNFNSRSGARVEVARKPIAHPGRTCAAPKCEA
jgi:hypothetical protein